jgi:hypothetical protein
MAQYTCKICGKSSEVAECPHCRLITAIAPPEHAELVKLAPPNCDSDAIREGKPPGPANLSGPIREPQLVFRFGLIGMILAAFASGVYEAYFGFAFEPRIVSRRYYPLFYALYFAPWGYYAGAIVGGFIGIVTPKPDGWAPNLYVSNRARQMIFRCSLGGMFSAALAGGVYCVIVYDSEPAPLLPPECVALIGALLFAPWGSYAGAVVGVIINFIIDDLARGNG